MAAARRKRRTCAASSANFAKPGSVTPISWSYTPRTASWGLEAQHIIDAIADGKDAETRRCAYEALAAEVGSDPESQVARRPLQFAPRPG